MDDFGTDVPFSVDELLAVIFGGSEVEDLMAAASHEPDVEITGVYSGLEWKVSVSKIGGTNDVNRLYEPGERWFVNVYEDDALTDSYEVDAVTAKSTQQVANEFAAHLFEYEI